MDGFSVLITMLVVGRHAAHRAGGRRLSQPRGYRGAEFHVLALMSASGAMLMGSANDLIIIFLGLEILSIALYVLTAFNHRPGRLGRGGAQVLHPGRLLLGHLRLRDRAHLRRHGLDQPDPDRRLPLQERRAHQRAPAGRPGPHAGRLRLQGGGGAVPHVDARRLRGCAHPGDRVHGRGGQGRGRSPPCCGCSSPRSGVISSDWQPIIYGLAVLSLLVGAVVALRQRDVKRMLAYSSINHAGFILLGVESATAAGRERLALLPGRLHVHDHRQLRHRHRARPPGGRATTTSPATGAWRSASPCSPCRFAILLLAQAGVPFTTGSVGQVAGRPGRGVGRCGAAGRDRHGHRRHRRLLLPPGGRAHVRVGIDQPRSARPSRIRLPPPARTAAGRRSPGPAPTARRPP